MSLNPSGMNMSYSWNYSKADKPDYSLELTGTIVSLQEVQAREFSMNGQPGRPAFWNDGNPRMNIRVGLATQDGSLKSITFNKASKAQREGKKPSLHMQLFGLTNNNMMELMGKTIHIWTWPAHPQTGQTWGQGNPRLYGVELVPGQTFTLSSPLPDEFKVPELLCNDAASGGQVVQQVVPQPVQQMQYQPQMQQQYAQPVQQMQPQMQQPVQQVQYQPQPVQQSVQQMQPQVQPQPQTQPQGMDPAVAQAMAAVQGNENMGVYSDDMIPF